MVESLVLQTMYAFSANFSHLKEYMQILFHHLLPALSIRVMVSEQVVQDMPLYIENIILYKA